MSRSVVQGTGGHVVPSLGRGPVHLNPAFSIALLFEPRPRPSVVMSQHSRRQINDLVVATDEQRREGCLRWRDGEHRHRCVDAAVPTCALGQTPNAGHAFHSCALNGCVLGGCGDNRFVGFSHAEQHLFKMLETCLLAHGLVTAAIDRRAILS